jgi:hypothetical protein
MGDYERATGRRQINMERCILIALAMFMEQHKENYGGHEATKALKGVLDKIGRFHGHGKKHYKLFESICL